MAKTLRNNKKRHHNASDQLHEHKQNMKNGLVASSSNVSEIPETSDDIKAEIIETDENEVATVTEIDDQDASDTDEEIDNHAIQR